MVGGMVLLLSQVLGTDYSWVERSLDGELSSLPLWLVPALSLPWILTTSLSIGSGGCGGVFGPGMVIGTFTGLAVWQILALIAPAMVAGGISWLIVDRFDGSICRSQVHRRAGAGEEGS